MREVLAAGCRVTRKRCRPATPQESKVLEELAAQLKRELPCGHKLGDLVAAPGTITSCGACALEDRGPALDPAEARLLARVRRACMETEAFDSAALRGEIPLVLRPSSPAEAGEEGDASIAWAIEVPTFGGTTFGRTPRAAFRRALKAIADTADERRERAKGEGS